MFDFLTKLLPCKHRNKNTIYIQDKYYDMMIDNDDLEDIPTIIKITYCTKCGKILEKHHIVKISNFQRIYWMGEWMNTCCESNYSDILEFEKITGLNHKDITCFNKV